jgi:predicted dehydrogenase
MSKVNIAVVGAGYWGKNIVRNIVSNSKTVLSAICDSDLDRAEKFKNEYCNTADVYSDFSKVLERNDIDAVSIVTPVYTHFELAYQALVAEKHVLIEKPMAMSAAEAKILVDFAKEKSLNVMCDHTFCYSAPVRKIEKIIQSGVIGQLLQVNSSRCNLGLLQTDVNVLWDLSPHDISIVNYVTNHSEVPLSVNAYGKTLPGYNYEVDAMLSIVYKSGLHVNIHNSWLYPTKTRKMSFVGTEKMIMWDDLLPEGEKVKVFNKGVNVINHKKFEYYDNGYTGVELDKTEPLALMIEEFADSIIECRKPLSGCKEGLATITLLEAAKKSIQNSNRISLVCT